MTQSTPKTNGEKTTRTASPEFAARRAEVAALKALILSQGQPETHPESTGICTQLRRRRGFVGGEVAEAQVYKHRAGVVIRFWVYGPDFSVKVRDLVLLPTFDKGPEIWLEVDDDKLFPHEGKYSVAARQLVNATLAGR